MLCAILGSLTLLAAAVVAVTAAVVMFKPPRRARLSEAMLNAECKRSHRYFNRIIRGN